MGLYSFRMMVVAGKIHAYCACSGPFLRGKTGRLSRIVSVLFALITTLITQAPLLASPIEQVYAFTDNRPSNDLFGTDGLRLSVQELVSSLSGFNSATAVGVNAGDTYTLRPSVEGGFNFVAAFPVYTGQTGPYNFTYTANGQTFGPVTSQPVSPIQIALPQNLRVSDFGLRPSLLFNSVAGANAYGIEIFNSQKQGIYISPTVSQPSVLVPGGLLQFGQDYFLQARGYVIDPNTHAIEARSSSYFGFRAFPDATFVPPANLFPTSPFAGVANFLQAAGASLDASVYNEFSAAISGAGALFDPSLSFKTKAEAGSRVAGATSTVLGAIASLTDPGSLALKFVGALDGLAMGELASTAPDGVSQLASFELSAYSFLKRTLPITPTSWWGAVLDGVSLGMNALSAELHIIGIDPFDPNYQTVAQSTFTPIASLTFSGVSSDRLTLATNVLNAIAQTEEYLRLASVSANRYNSALASGDTKSALEQLMAFVDYLAEYNQSAQLLATLLEQLQSQLNADSIGQLAYSPDILAAIQALLLQNGLDADTLSFLESLGLSDADISTISTEFLALDPAAFQGTISDQLNTESIAVLSATAVPEPASIWLFLLPACIILILQSTRLNFIFQARRHNQFPT